MMLVMKISLVRFWSLNKQIRSQTRSYAGFDEHMKLFLAADVIFSHSSIVDARR